MSNKRLFLISARYSFITFINQTKAIFFYYLRHISSLVVLYVFVVWCGYKLINIVRRAGNFLVREQLNKEFTCL